jgi:lipopolysaccharide biosynthesis protein
MLLFNPSRLPSFLRQSAARIPFRWIRIPDILKGDRVCIFVSYARQGKIPEHSLFHARAWQQHGYKTTIVVVLDDLDHFPSQHDTDFASGLCVRLNRGYDFGAWAATIQRMPDLESANLLVVANDSVYGPVRNFRDFLARIDACGADVIGMTESHEITNHFQSYMIAFRQKAIRSNAFRAFWRNVRTGDRDFVIQHYELKMLKRMRAGNLRAEALFLTPLDTFNPTLKYWRELTLGGFPFIKVQLLRENPLKVDISGWQALITDKDFNIDLIKEHLGAAFPAPAQPLN